MRNRIGSLRALAITTTLSFAAASAASAQNLLFTWTGRVDEEVQLVMNGRSVTTTNVGAREPGERAAYITTDLPRESGEVTADLVSGRGTVEVLRQPTAANGYTTIIRIRDPQPGAGDYRVRALWQASANGDVALPPDRGLGYIAGGGMRDGTHMALAWQGDVDGTIDVRVAPNGTSYHTLDGKDPRGIQTSSGGLPSGATHVTVEQMSGRGQVYVVQQPTEENGFVALVRIVDPKPGFSHYSFNLMWR